MFRGRYGGYWILGILTLIGSVAGTLAWFIHYIATLANTPNEVQAISPIDLAGVTATLGSLLLVGAFYREKEEKETDGKKEVTSDLKTIGKLILLSSASFIITYFLLEYVRILKPPFTWNWFFIVATDLAFLAAGMSLSIALGFLVTIVRFL